MKPEHLINLIGGEIAQSSPALTAETVGSFVIDSREVIAGDVFFALSQPEYKNNGFNGDFDDATTFVAASLERGAIACVVRRDRYEEHLQELEKYKDRLIFVDDCIAALQRLAHGIYLEWNKPVVAVTGSAGKTTAKELTAHVLAFSGRKVLKNIKNYNNGLGHPLTVLNLAKDPSYDVAVLEMGMSTPMHEIARLCSITPPDVAVELNVLPVHIEHLGSIENIAAAKAELVDGMRSGGTAVLNADDPRVLAMSGRSKGSVLTYGIDNDADIRAFDISSNGFGHTSFTLDIHGQTAKVNFGLNGKHNVLNALAAASVGHSFGMSVSEIAEAIQTAAAPPQRGQILKFNEGFTVINDSYNSNPDALISMVATLIEGGSAAKRKIVVAGEMLELGDIAVASHKKCGQKIAEMGVDLLIGVRGHASEMVDAAISAGLEFAEFAKDSDAAAEMLSGIIAAGDAVLVKGSRGVRTEKVVDELLEKYHLEESSSPAV